MTESKPDQLIKEIIHFIESERNLYGDFSIPEDCSPESESIASAKQNSSIQNAKGASEPAPENNMGTNDNVEKDPDDINDQIKQCNTLEELEALCQKSEILKTDLKGTQLVFGVGNSDADLMLIGEAPGAEEDRQGEPFVGKAGQLLNKILEAINFRREDVYIANILKHRPPNNRNPKPEERKRSLPFLLRQIDLVNPKLILSLGKISTQTLLDKELSLSKMRGKFHTFRDKYQLMATYHPAALLRHNKWKRPTWKDVQRLRKKYDELNGSP